MDFEEAYYSRKHKRRQCEGKIYHDEEDKEKGKESMGWTRSFGTAYRSTSPNTIDRKEPETRQ